MCAGAIQEARIKRVVFGCFDTKRGAFGSGDGRQHPSLEPQSRGPGRRAQGEKRKPAQEVLSTAEGYRSGRNGADSKSVDRLISGPGVRIPLPPP